MSQPDHINKLVHINTMMSHSGNQKFHMSTASPTTDRLIKFLTASLFTTLISFYVQAALIGDLWSNTDWTISSIMLYKYNQPIAWFVMLPLYMTVCLTYVYKFQSTKDQLRIRMGGIPAIIGGIGIFIYPVNTHELQHLTFASMIFVSAFFLRQELNAMQYKGFCCAAVLATLAGLTLPLQQHWDWPGRFGFSSGIKYQAQDASEFVPGFFLMAAEFTMYCTFWSMCNNPVKIETEPSTPTTVCGEKMSPKFDPMSTKSTLCSESPRTVCSESDMHLHDFDDIVVFDEPRDFDFDFNF